MRTLFLLLALTLAAQLPVGTVLAADDGSEAEDEDEEDGAPGDSESPSTDEDSAPAEDAAQVEAGESPMGAEQPSESEGAPGDEPAPGDRAGSSEADPVQAAPSQGVAPPQDSAAAAAPSAGSVDDLGRPFPDPLILRRARGWTGAGVVLSGAGAGLVLTGLTLGSALARGEIAPVPGAGGIVGGIFGFGLGLAVAGVPLLAAGPFTVRQLQRTIRGAEKVPRTVANESRYWRAYLTRQYALAFQVAGGGAVLLGVLSSVAVGVLVGTERYDPAYWGIVAGGFGGGAVLIIGGLALSKRAVAAMEAVRDEVDPLRQDAPESSSLRVLPQVGPPLPSFGVRRDESGQDEVFGSLRWTLLF